MKFLGILILSMISFSSMAQTPTRFNRSSLELTNLTMKCAKEYDQIMKHLSGHAAGVVEASVIASEDEIPDKTYTLTFGDFSLFRGERRTHTLTIVSDFTKFECGNGEIIVADCGGGSTKITCTVKKL